MARHTQYSFHGTNYGTLAAAKKVAQQYANDTGRKTYVSVNTLVESKQGNYTDYKMVELAPKSRKKNPTVSTSALPIGTWQPAHAIRQNADGSVDILREKNSGRRANISEGFMDANGLFHPIRHSADYDSSRVGESKQYKKKRKKGTRATPTGRRYTAKKASTKPAMATSRREYGGEGSRYRNASKRRSNGSSEVYELVSFIENDGGLYRSQGSAIIKNLAAKKGRGIYSSSKAATLYGYLVTNGAKKYAKESGDAASWNKMFTTADRKEAAKRLVENFEDNWNSGSYREYVPKKYQDKV